MFNKPIAQKRIEAFSYSKLSMFLQCPMKYKFHYEDKKYPFSPSLPSDMGSLIHKIREIANLRELVREPRLTTGEIYDYLVNGIEKNELRQLHDEYKHAQTVSPDVKVHDAIKEKRFQTIHGTKQLKTMYPEDWNTPDKNNMSWADKLKLFVRTFYEASYYNASDIIGAELDVTVPFEFNYNGDNHLIHLTGSIDSLRKDNANGNLLIIDYKTNGSQYKPDSLHNCLQMSSYAMSVDKIFNMGLNETQGNINNIDFTYDMTFLNIQQCATVNLHQTKQLFAKVFQDIYKCRDIGIWKPNPSPLCNWCVFRKDSDVQTLELRKSGVDTLCDYYSLWKPQSKTNNVNKKWIDETEKTMLEF